MADIVITEFMDDAAIEALSVEFDVHYDPGLADHQDDIAGLLTGTRALIVRNRTKVTAGLLDAGPDITAVGRLGVGLDNIDLDAAKARDVQVFPATGANDASVAEYVITAAMMLLRTAWLGTDEVASGTWPRTSMIGREIGGKTLGLLGYGSIARQTATRARALGMDVIAHDPFIDPVTGDWTGASPVDMKGLLTGADVLSLHVPLTEQTRHVIGRDALSEMKSEAVLINAARGGVVDEDALCATLKADALAGAALDVFEIEPLTAEAGAKFDGLNVLLTPHIAGVTEESNVRVSALIAEKIRDALS